MYKGVKISKIQAPILVTRDINSVKKNFSNVGKTGDISQAFSVSTHFKADIRPRYLNWRENGYILAKSTDLCFILFK